MKRHTLWVIRPDALTTIARALSREPSEAACNAIAPILGRVPAPSELLAMMREEVISDGMLSDQAAAKLGAREAPVTGGIAVIPLQGLIRPKASLLSLLFGGGGGLQFFRTALRGAVANEDVSSILIDVDSPGGLIDLVPETAAEIREARNSKPVRAIANTDAASAAYWLASQADELIVTPSGQVGSIGVFALHEDWSRYDEQLGVATTLISAGKYKTEANPYEPLSDEAREAIQANVDELYGMFVGDVAKGRGTKAATVRSEFGEGRMVMATASVQEGMADRVESFESVKARLSGGGSRRSRKAIEPDESAEFALAERARYRKLLLAHPGHVQPKEG